MSRLRPLIEGKARYILILIILTGVGVAFWVGVERLKVDTDITSALPGNDPVVTAAQQILKHHPVLENVFIQISMSGSAPDVDALIEAGDFVSSALQESGLVKVMSGKEGASSFASLLEAVTENLPLFFSRDELEGQIQGSDPSGSDKEIFAGSVSSAGRRGQHRTDPISRQRPVGS